ncbi:serine hydrolase domain-containing protein [Fimbriimonas ginsengisoli]|uniref:Beta-lactamase n=1 Tax=Fimbriimonas ginsengisoli Gsoil 348 TaxID=661478 RepID=A0A068NYE8_FIMGI|nr:serine hydrolase domain-containing protein [Fimbriimonas ginsengisoli]AIE88055.1 beta-lactamase [Fimbriimonas ginsengisoli Gsoil 348]
MRELFLEAIANGVFPGVAYSVWHEGRLSQDAFGHFTYDPSSSVVGLDTIWDLASVSKVVGTTTAAMMLVEEGRLELDSPVASVLPEFGQNGKEDVTFTNLMVHDSGLVAFRRYHEFCRTPEEILAAIYAESLTYETGTQCVYSDLSMIVVGKAIEQITGQSLDEFLAKRLFQPLGMRDTGFFPPRERCAPTEVQEEWRSEIRSPRGPYIQGEVHDPTAMALGGVAGHAGLFSTVGDLTTFMSALVSGRIVSHDTVTRFTARQSELSSRALGWDTKSDPCSAGTLFGPRSFGHTGYTGTSVWCDPDRDLFAVLLSNRVHPTSENAKIIQFRPRFHDAVVRMIE